MIPVKKNSGVLLVVFGIIVIGLALFLAIPRQTQDEDRVQRDMISQIDESGIYQSTYDLQNFSTREYPSPENTKVAEYLHDRLAAIPGLKVEYQSDRYRNVIATLPGEDTSSDEIVLVGAHYDCTSSDPAHAPGATDNGGGAAIVLELARVMSKYHFNRTVQFAFWNAEEDSQKREQGVRCVCREELPGYPPVHELRLFELRPGRPVRAGCHVQ